MSDTAVLVVDMLNSYQHPDAELLIPDVAEIIEPLAKLVRRAGNRDDIDVIYVNDNYGRYLVALDPSEDQVNQAWGIDVLTTTQNPLGQGLFIDTSKFGRVAIREPLGMFLGYSQDDFVRNLLRWVAEERLVLTVERPAAVLAIKSLPTPTAAEAPPAKARR